MSEAMTHRFVLVRAGAEFPTLPRGNRPTLEADVLVGLTSPHPHKRQLAVVDQFNRGLSAKLL